MRPHKPDSKRTATRIRSGKYGEYREEDYNGKEEGEG